MPSGAIRLLGWLPCFTKQNGHSSELSGRTKAEFYLDFDAALGMSSINEGLLRWERVHNTIRIHPSLGRNILAKGLLECSPSLAPLACCLMGVGRARGLDSGGKWVYICQEVRRLAY